MHNILTTCSEALTIVTLKIDIFYSIPDALCVCVSLTIVTLKIEALTIVTLKIDIFYSIPDTLCVWPMDQ